MKTSLANLEPSTSPTHGTGAAIEPLPIKEFLPST
jgi:hypothetical protein